MNMFDIYTCVHIPIHMRIYVSKYVPLYIYISIQSIWHTCTRLIYINHANTRTYQLKLTLLSGFSQGGRSGRGWWAKKWRGGG